jgi:hypothetical protein
MSGIFQGDIFIKLAIELGMEDMRKNPWLIEHMLSDLKNINYAADKYGQKNIDACKEWFRNNQIDVYLRGRDDKDRLPCVTIQLGPSNEKPDMKLMADQSTEKTILLPNKIGKPIPYIIKPFVPTGYDPTTGEISLDPSIDVSGVAVGMILVNPANGKGYKILDVVLATPGSGILIEPGLEIEATQFGIVPQFPYYEARIEHTFFDESYSIGCHAHGDPQNLLFLWSIVLYSILRYRESLLEANGYAESSISSAGPDFDESFTTPGGEKAWARYMNLTGQVENSWIKSPRRFIEVAALKKKVGNGYIGGISIISNTDPIIVDKSQVNWYTDTVEEADPKSNDES